MIMAINNEALPLTFDEFSPVSKADWLKRIEKDLKTRATADLLDTLPPLSIGDKKTPVDPFAHADDFSAKPFSTLFPKNKKNNAWLINEQFYLTREPEADKEINKQILAALAGGANAISINLPKGAAQLHWDNDRLNTLFEGVYLNYIHLLFDLSDILEPLPILEKMYAFALENGFYTSELQGGVFLFHTYPTENTPSVLDTSDGIFNAFQLENSLKIAAWAAKHFPLFKVLGVHISSHSDKYDDVVDSLAYGLYVGNAILKQAEKNSSEIQRISEQIFFEFSCQKNYLTEIARLRAFKLLWANVLLAYKLTPSVSNVSARIFCQNSNENTQKIEATTKAMSATMGGVDFLSVEIGDNSNFDRRIARNVLNIMQLESHLDRVIDPAAGSFYLESLTEKLAESAWLRFQEMTF